MKEEVILTLEQAKIFDLTKNILEQQKQYMILLDQTILNKKNINEHLKKEMEFSLKTTNTLIHRKIFINNNKMQ